MEEKALRIAVSGTYSTGKTTTTEALSILTGIPRSYARTMRQLLPVYIPGKRLEDCTPFELFNLGLRRFKERAVNESKLENGFFTDGSSIHEYVYGLARLKVGMNPNASAFVQGVSKAAMYPFKKMFVGFIDSFGELVKSHAVENYHSFIHLPVEFPLVPDGHRPFNERFRRICDQLLIQTLEELEIKYHIVSGSIEERLQKVLDIYNFTPVTDIKSAVEEAQIRTRFETIEKEKPITA